ncbi:MAG: DUF4040 domain-containing protein [Leptolyngbyaceae cyanobacterium SM1_1_3]|nr:DUF4040 domain-containing protein [Leptolyngbyaceae cyanobacterium SM1_1_3]
MTDSYLYPIVALLPLTACILVFQVNPYHALVIRGILGAVAALVYAVLGAADVALTEALVGTMLAITLYAVAVRSSLVMRLGVLESASATSLDVSQSAQPQLEQWLDNLRTLLIKHHLRLELVNYPDRQRLHQALKDQDVHAICTPLEAESLENQAIAADSPIYCTTIRIPRLYDILQSELSLVSSHALCPSSSV